MCYKGDKMVDLSIFADFFPIMVIMWMFYVEMRLVKLHKMMQAIISLEVRRMMRATGKSYDELMIMMKDKTIQMEEVKNDIS